MIPDAEPLRSEGKRVPQEVEPRRVLGPLKPERVSGGPSIATTASAPAMSVAPGDDPNQPAPAAVAPAVPAPEPSSEDPRPFDSELLSWWEEELGREEIIGPGHNLLRRLLVLGITAGAVGLVIQLVTTAGSAAILLPIGLCALSLVLIGRLWPWAASRRAVNQRVFGTGGGALSSGSSRFSKENVAKGVAGERRTALALEALLRIPGTRIFHGLRFPGSRVADIDHAVVNGDRVLFIDSKFWKPGEYRWLEADKLGYVRGRRVDRRDIHMDHLQLHPLTAKAAAEVGCHVVIHPNAEGAIRFTPGGHISPTGIPATDIQDGMEMIGRWLLQGRKSGLVDRYVMARMIAMLK